MTQAIPHDDPSQPAITPPEPEFWTGRIRVRREEYSEIQICASDRCVSEMDARITAVSNARVLHDECETVTEVLEQTSK